jgi:hypothetical protein
MNSDQMKGNWKQFVGKAKEKGVKQPCLHWRRYRRVASGRAILAAS